MGDRQDPKNEGHTKEWQDRARVMLDAKKAAGTEASPNQSPVTGTENNETQDERTDRKETEEKDDRFY